MDYIPEYDAWKLQNPPHYDYSDQERECECCGEIFDEEVTVSVDDYDFCAECLKLDPEVWSDVIQCNSHLEEDNEDGNN